MILEADALLKQLQQRQFQPVYFLQGEEPYYIDAVADLIEQTALAEHERSFNQVVIYGKDVDVMTKGRHDPCVGIRAVPVGEAMVACVVADQFLRHRGQVGESAPWPFPA